MNLPNQLTLMRLILVPIFVGLMSVDHVVCYSLAYLVVVLAGITDYYDGKIARNRNLITDFGKLIDPIVDKILITGAFVMLMTVPELSIPAWTVVVIIGREFLVTGVRSWAASGGVVIDANKWGKTKVAIQMAYIWIFLFLTIAKRVAEHVLAADLGLWSRLLQGASRWAAVFVAVFTVYSGLQFARINRDNLKFGHP
jgi:CDP-diacylglycerol--glycerol-3-phosphate 3-phosphatidyltransferase